MFIAINRGLKHFKLWGLFPIFIKIVRLIIKYIIGIVINLLLTFIILAIRPLWKIKIVNITSDRIGHLAYNTDYFFRKLQNKKNVNYQETTYLGICQKPAANDQLLKMFSRNIPIMKISLKLYFLITILSI